MSKDPSETNEISKVYRDPRGSLISMEMFGITLREVGALEEGGAKKKHIDTYIYIYMCIWGWVKTLCPCSSHQNSW